MRFVIDPSSPEAIFHQLARQVRAGVATDALPAGTVLPPAREIASALGINMHTVLHAYQVLRDEGVLELRRGRGAVVTGRGALDEAMRASLSELAGHAARLGLSAAAAAALVSDAVLAQQIQEGSPA